MPRLSLSVLILVLALATFSEASWKPRSQPQAASSGLGTHGALEPQQLDQLGLTSHHRRQLGPQGPQHFKADMFKKQRPWMEEEEEAYGWMDFGRRSAEEEDRHD
ncbi:gastrin [Psammomys obesus]|nr:gastrin [Psammomys obesus]